MLLTLVVRSTFDKRGKSATPASNVLIEESSKESESLKEDTQPSNECAIVNIINWCVFGVLCFKTRLRCSQPY
jgi:hypothetical protein